MKHLAFSGNSEAAPILIGREYPLIGYQSDSTVYALPQPGQKAKLVVTNDKEELFPIITTFTRVELEYSFSSHRRFIGNVATYRGMLPQGERLRAVGCFNPVGEHSRLGALCLLVVSEAERLRLADRCTPKSEELKKSQFTVEALGIKKYSGVFHPAMIHTGDPVDDLIDGAFPRLRFTEE